MIKKILLSILKAIANLFYYKIDLFSSTIHPLVAVKMGFMQRILGFNRNVIFPVHFTSRVINSQNIKLGKNSGFPGYSIGSYIQANSGIIIGENTRIGPGVAMISENHDLIDNLKHTKSSPIIIGDNCWLGAKTVILPGVELGDYTIVGAGAVVSKSFKKGYCVIGGVPAKIIKNLTLK